MSYFLKYLMIKVGPGKEWWCLIKTEAGLLSYFIYLLITLKINKCLVIQSCSSFNIFSLLAFLLCSLSFFLPFFQ